MDNMAHFFVSWGHVSCRIGFINLCLGAKWLNLCMNRKLILISNDDGVEAKGLKALVNTVSEIADVVVLAPLTQQSGMSSSVSSGVDVALHTVSRQEHIEVYAATGTPVDCVKLAFYTVCKDRRPDLVLAGINKGANNSINVIYSGTMGAVIEGCLNGIPSIGFSQCVNFSATDVDYEPGLPVIRQMVADVLSGKLEIPKGVCLNVNFPAVDVVKEPVWCRQSQSQWIKEFTPAGMDGQGNPVYRLGGEFVTLNQEDTSTDSYWLLQGHATVVPIGVDMSHIDTIRKYNKQ